MRRQALIFFSFSLLMYHTVKLTKTIRIKNQRQLKWLSSNISFYLGKILR